MNIISMKPVEIVEAWEFASGEDTHKAFDLMLGVIEAVTRRIVCSHREAAELSAWLGIFRPELLDDVSRDDLYQALSEVRAEFRRVYCRHGAA